MRLFGNSRTIYVDIEDDAAFGASSTLEGMREQWDDDPELNPYVVLGFGEDEIKMVADYFEKGSPPPLTSAKQARVAHKVGSLLDIPDLESVASQFLAKLLAISVEQAAPTPIGSLFQLMHDIDTGDGDLSYAVYNTLDPAVRSTLEKLNPLFVGYSDWTIQTTNALQSFPYTELCVKPTKRLLLRYLTLPAREKFRRQTVDFEAWFEELVKDDPGKDTPGWAINTIVDIAAAILKTKSTSSVETFKKGAPALTQKTGRFPDTAVIAIVSYGGTAVLRTLVEHLELPYSDRNVEYVTTNFTGPDAEHVPLDLFRFRPSLDTERNLKANGWTQTDEPELALGARPKTTTVKTFLRAVLFSNNQLV
jgi:hypothetical protein